MFGYVQMRSKLKTLSYVEHALSVYENNLFFINIINKLDKLVL